MFLFKKLYILQIKDLYSNFQGSEVIRLRGHTKNSYSSTYDINRYNSSDRTQPKWSNSSLKYLNQCLSDGRLLDSLSLMFLIVFFFYL